MTLRLDKEQERALSLLADVDGVSKHEAVLRAILEAADRRVRRSAVEQLSAAGQARYASLLARLAE